MFCYSLQSCYYPFYEYVYCFLTQTLKKPFLKNKLIVQNMMVKLMAMTFCFDSMIMGSFICLISITVFLLLSLYLLSYFLQMIIPAFIGIGIALFLSLNCFSLMGILLVLSFMLGFWILSSFHYCHSYLLLFRPLYYYFKPFICFHYY